MEWGAREFTCLKKTSVLSPAEENKPFLFLIILDLTVVLNFAIDGVWINFLDDFGERFRERSVR